MHFTTTPGLFAVALQVAIVGVAVFGAVAGLKGQPELKPWFESHPGVSRWFAAAAAILGTVVVCLQHGLASDMGAIAGCIATGVWTFLFSSGTHETIGKPTTPSP